MVANPDEGSTSSEVSSYEQMQSNAPSSMVDDTHEGRISSKDISNLYHGIANLESKSSDSVVGDHKSTYLQNK